MQKAQVAGDGHYIVLVIVIESLFQSSLMYLFDYDYEHRFAKHEHEFPRIVDMVSFQLGLFA